MKRTGRNTSKRPTNSHIVSRTMLNGKFFTYEVSGTKKLFFAYDNLCTLDKTNPTRGPNHFLHCFFVQKWKWPLQEWTRFNEIIVQIANHSCPGHSDVWRFCNNDFIFVMSTCRFFITPGRGQGAGGRVPCRYPCVKPAAGSTPATRC